MRYFDVKQGSSEWFDLRKGVPTASNFSKILTPKTGRLSSQADDYIAELIGNQLSLIPPEGIENYTNRAIRWGEQTEEEARRFYCLHNNCDVQNGGFCMTDDGRFGCSPDFLVGFEANCIEWQFDEQRGDYLTGTVKAAGELKCPQSDTHTKYIIKGELPTDYRWQCQGHIFVTGADYCDFESYCPGLAPLLVRVERGPDTETLAAALEEFHEKYQTTLKRVKEMA